MIAEELLHFIWQFRLFNQLELYSTDDEQIKIQFVGRHNKDAGPDFLDARIWIAGQSWHGNVEIHVDGNDWTRHGHQVNESYNTVILHVVYRCAVPVYRADGTRIPSVVLGGFLDERLLVSYRQLMDSRLWISCAAQLPQVDQLSVQITTGRMLTERMEDSYFRIQNLYKQTQADWEKMLFLFFCRSFGMKVNAEAFMQLGHRIDLTLIRKYVEEPSKQAALFFGQAGFLKGSTDDYLIDLKKEYSYLKKIHDLSELNAVEWKFMRMRPSNFPTFRIAQLIGIYGYRPYLFASLLDCTTLQEVLSLFAIDHTADYWRYHYHFNQRTPVHATKLSKNFKHHVLINAVIPLLFSYGKVMGRDFLQQRALNWLEEIKAEDNTIIRQFVAYGINVKNAADSQALLQLKKYYCDQKKCLSCSIGLSILKS